MLADSFTARPVYQIGPEQFARNFHLGICVQLCMTYIDHPSQVPKRYD